MIKKYKLVVGSQNLQAPAKPNRFINSPNTGTPRFCDFPKLNALGKEFAGGPIYLREGRHRGPSQGHGFQHIWHEHFSDIVDPKDAELRVATFVATILVVGSTIYYEGGIGTQSERALIWQNPHGVVILQERLDGVDTIVYNVVTAYPASNPKGSLIGRL